MQRSRARRLVLKARYAGERARAHVGNALSREPSMLPLDDIHRRLEVVLSAAYGRPIVISPNAERGWMRRRLGGLLPFLFLEGAPTVDGDTIKLPPRIATHGDRRLAMDRYRLFAMEQAERLARGTIVHASIADPLERDLYLIREGAAIDASIARSYPGMHAAMEDERASALARRPRHRLLTSAERSVERLLERALTTPLDQPGTVSANPAESREWARRMAREIRDGEGGIRRRYRGVPLSPAWGSVPRASIESTQQAPGYNPPQSLLPGPTQGTGSSSSDSENDGPKSERPDKNSHEDATRPDTSGRAADDGAESDRRDDTSPPPPTPEASDASGGSPSSSDASDRTPATAVAAGRLYDLRGQPADTLPPATYYDEWDSRRGAYIRSGTAVRLYPPQTGDPSWLRDELQSHGATARQIRRQFERLRPRRTLSVRQPRGDALDLGACVDALVARRMGGAPDDRLYVDARRARRGIAIALLVDASGSTDTRVTESWRIIDLEKIALLLATQALDALGDLYAIYAFAGRQASNVKVTVVKDFSEASGDHITRRIAAITPEAFTRLGAVVRHATRELARQTAGHRLLLLLSDGRPNDVDAYQGPYGVEDSRQAILEARASGVFPYCLTIDQTASEYLPRIFGRAGHTILQQPKQLPKALLTVVRSLIQQ